ncbi:hypothetical protein IW261DRAFT_1394889 [Armillaria novae-zelandiae]|uniref:RNB domain-containing protein n=1 Tax=Armillaria novae-zelandiae TaxID=153914 RepID=A0AA39PJ47_9AGAR|nr:hypothetical protein IW261DRAFT_1394889 [Armillaria novae-zelandiae]
MYNAHRCAALRGSLLSDLRVGRCTHTQAGSSKPKDRQRRTPEGLHRSNFQRQPQKFHKQPSPRIDFDSVENLAERLIGTSDQREVSGWKHTKSLRGDEMRLASTIKVKQDLPRFSTEKQAMEAVDPMDRLEALADYEVVPAVKAAPGTFVEIRRHSAIATGIILTSSIIARREVTISLTDRGEVLHHQPDDITFAVPGVVSEDLIQRSGYSDFSANHKEHNARVQILKQLKDIGSLVNDLRVPVLSTLSTLYPTLRNSNPEKWGLTNVSELTRMFKRNPTFVDIFAVHLWVWNNLDKFSPAATYSVTQNIRIRPENHYNRIKNITTWMHQKASPIDSFALKARPIIQKSRRHQVESIGEPPSWIPGDHKWTPTDILIISYLLDALRAEGEGNKEPYLLGQSAILKKVDPDVVLVDQDTIYQILLGIGVAAPWHDMTAITPTDEGDPVQEAAIVARSMSADPSSDVLGPEDLYRADPLQAVRHDFGDLNVYVIDDSTAKELDDGISVERIPMEPDTYWLHIHIADPASLIPPTHLFATQALQRGQTYYYGTRTFPMLPAAFTGSKEFGLSLGDLLESGKSQRVLTFSCKVNLKGDLLDYKVRGGLVKNINLLTYHSVNEALGYPTETKVYPFGDTPPSSTRHPLTDEHIDDLRIMDQIAGAFVARRFRDNVYLTSSSKAEIQFDDASSIPSLTMDPGHFRGFVGMAYSVENAKLADTGARSLVAESMKLACRAASRFFLKHDIPALRRTLQAPTHKSDTDLQKILDMRSPNAYVERTAALPYVVAESKSSYSLEPRGHHQTGSLDGEGYVRVTSPLRRAADLQAHWQLVNALSGRRKPLFSPEELMQYTEVFWTADRYNKRMEGRNRALGQVYYLQQWLATPALRANRPDPLQNLEGVVMDVPFSHVSTKRYLTVVQVESLGLRAFLGDMDSIDDAPLGTTVPIKLSHVTTGCRPMIHMSLR